MKIEAMTELEVFKLAATMAATTLAGDERMTSVVNPDDIMIDRIKSCHSALQASLQELLGKGSRSEH